MNDVTDRTFLVVIGAGPGGYPAAFHAADMGMEVMLIDREPTPGGVCLFRGCIPSKSILHASHSIQRARETPDIGITFGKPEIDLEKLRSWKNGVVEKLGSGLEQMTKQRKINYVQGEATFVDPETVQIQCLDGETRTVRFEHALIATGSEPVRLPFLPDSPRVLDSTNALALESLPNKMLVIGGGYIGLELGQAFAALGTRVSVVEALPSLLHGVDRDLVDPLTKRLERQFENVMLETKVKAMTEIDDALKVEFDGPDGRSEARFDATLVAVGRRPTADGMGLENAAVSVDQDGFIKVDQRRRTSRETIMAVGDVVGNPMLAHKATHEGLQAVEGLNDGKTIYDPRAIPAVIFTDPEIAWCGLTEGEARRSGANIRKGVFPWRESGRAATLSRQEGTTKVIADAEEGFILGAGVSGENAGELIAEAVLAIEMGAVVEDVALSIHPHPTLSESLMEAARRAMD